MLSFKIMEMIAKAADPEKKSYFSTGEIARWVGLPPWRIRRSLRSLASGEFAHVWTDGNDNWCLNPMAVKMFRLIWEIENASGE